MQESTLLHGMDMGLITVKCPLGFIFVGHHAEIQQQLRDLLRCNNN